jgi:hypothetical protein
MYMEEATELPLEPGALRAKRRCARSSLERIWSIMARSAVSGASAELRDGGGRPNGLLLLGGGYMGFASTLPGLARSGVQPRSPTALAAGWFRLSHEGGLGNWKTS